MVTRGPAFLGGEIGVSNNGRSEGVACTEMFTY